MNRTLNFKTNTRTRKINSRTFEIVSETRCNGKLISRETKRIRY